MIDKFTQVARPLWGQLGFFRSAACALQKRKLLIQKGLTRQALLMTIVRERNDQGHTILTVKTNRGDFILDNMTDEIRPWEATGYRFLKRQSQEDPNSWVAIKPSNALPEVGSR